MRLTRRTVLAGTAAVVAAPTAAATNYWPGNDSWVLQGAGAAGFDPGKLDAAVAAGLAAQSSDVLVLRGGKLVAEQYAKGWGPHRSREVASVGKSLVAVLIGMAIDDGHIQGLDQPAADFVPGWRGRPKDAITLRHLMSMTSGLDDTGIALRGVQGDQFAINAAAPPRDPPGTRWAYNTAVYHLLFHVVERAVGEPFEAYAKRKLLDPLGMADTSWLTNQGRGESGPVTNYYTAICSGRDLARFGLFAQRGGRWNGKQLVDAKFFRTMTTPSQALNPSYGLLWWLNSRPGVAALGGTGARTLRFPGAPADTIAALGAGGQAVMIVPSRDLVVVRQGDPPGSADMLPALLTGVLGALKG